MTEYIADYDGDIYHFPIKTGYSKQPPVVMDWNSLYPQLLISYSLDYKTYLTEDKSPSVVVYSKSNLGQVAEVVKTYHYPYHVNSPTGTFDWDPAFVEPSLMVSGVPNGRRYKKKKKERPKERHYDGKNLTKKPLQQHQPIRYQNKNSRQFANHR